jgi:hypothetical protein
LVWLFQNEMNDKFNTLPSPDDLAQSVTWAGLEDALQGIRQDCEDLQQPTERVVIEMSSQTDPIVSHILYQSDRSSSKSYFISVGQIQ